MLKSRFATVNSSLSMPGGGRELLLNGTLGEIRTCELCPQTSAESIMRFRYVPLDS
jgi:hypothetical protein